MVRCSKVDKDGKRICNGEVFYPEVGRPYCSNVKCNHPAGRKTNRWSDADQ